MGFGTTLGGGTAGIPCMPGPGIGAPGEMKRLAGMILPGNRVEAKATCRRGAEGVLVRASLAVDGACPACALPLHLKLGQPWRERTILRCDGCGRRLTLVLPPVAGD